MINIGIIDDEAEHAAKLKGYILQYAEDYKEIFNIKTFNNAVIFLEKYTADYDVIFMDIKMPYMNGITAAHKLREVDKNVMLFFITSMQQYAIKGYEVEAIDYIVKPIGYFEFALKFAKAMDKLGKSGNTKELIVPTETGYKKLRLANIKYVEVKNHHCRIYAADGEYRLCQPLNYVAEKLSGGNFIKCNNYCLVNLDYVTSINGLTAAVGNTVIEISRPRKKDFIKSFTELNEKI